MEKLVGIFSLFLLNHVFLFLCYTTLQKKLFLTNWHCFLFSSEHFFSPSGISFLGQLSRSRSFIFTKRIHFNGICSEKSIAKLFKFYVHSEHQSTSCYFSSTFKIKNEWIWKFATSKLFPSKKTIFAKTKSMQNASMSVTIVATLIVLSTLLPSHWLPLFGQHKKKWVIIF